MTARSGRIVLFATTAAAVITVLLWFFVFRTNKQHNPFTLVPGDALMVALMERDVLLRHAAGNATDATAGVKQWSASLMDLDHPFGFVIARVLSDAQAAATPGEPYPRPVMCVISEKSASHWVMMIPVTDPVKLTGEMGAFQRSGLRIDRHQGYTRYFWKDYLIAHNDHYLIAMASPPGTLQAATASAFAKLVSGDRNVKPFHESLIAKQLLLKEGDIVAWISPDPVLKWMAEVPFMGMFPGLAEWPHEHGYLATMNFEAGKMTMEATPVSMDGKTVARSETLPDPRHYRHHPATDLLAMGAVHLPGLLHPPGDQINTETTSAVESLSGLLGSQMIRELIPVIKGHGVLSVSHKPAQLGQVMAELMSGFGDIEDPFALLSPVLILTLEIDETRFEQAMKELIRRKVITQEGSVFKIRALPAGLPPSARRFLTFYLHRAGDMAIITNQKEIAARFSSAGIPENNRIPLVQQQIRGTLALDLRMASLYNLLGNPNASEMNELLLAQSDRVVVSFHSHKISAEVLMKEKETSPVFQLLMMITGDETRRKP